MSKNLELVAAVDLTKADAEMILESLQAMNRVQNIELVDAAIVTKDEEGKVHVQETKEVTGRKGAKRGLIAGAAFGLFLPPALIGAAVAGGGIGAIMGKLRDTGIKSDTMNEVAESLRPGEYALLALAEPTWVVPIENALTSHGRLLKGSLTAEESAVIAEAAESVEAAPTPDSPAPDN
jgi:uncharacterized membrane protein